MAENKKIVDTFLAHIYSGTIMKICNIITGSIAAYKQIDLLRAVQAQGHGVEVIVTRSAAQFVSPHVLATFCGGRVWEDDVMASEPHGEMRHIRLGRESDLILVAPATADLIAQMAHGCAGTLALATLLASSKPVIVAPAMNPTMWAHPATQANVALLKARGVQFLGPCYGQVACGDVGEGKYIDETTLLAAIKGQSLESPSLSLPSPSLSCPSPSLSLPSPSLSFPRRREPMAPTGVNPCEEGGKDDLRGKRVIITLGSTREYLDPVRYLGNVSSGATGVALAQALMAQGASVELICGFVTVDLPTTCSVTYAHTAEEMFEAAEKALPADIFIGCAAVCDYKPQAYAPEKIKKTEGSLELSLIPNRDVLKDIAIHPSKRPTCVIGFALESTQGEENAQEKVHRKNLDGIVLNYVSHLVEGGNVYSFFSKGSQEQLGALKKGPFAQVFAERLADGFFGGSQSLRAVKRS
jgi:phosphopantothenoylcysteine decarboxylase/phosphopantothenate--cysteine ligase